MIYKIIYCFLISCAFSLYAEEISTFYGEIVVEEPVLLELIHSPAFKRLKAIHQYGISYYITHQEEYSRYDHSLGVFAILRKNNASLEEQIAGLLHDVSHTIFSHVGDWVFNKEHQEIDYQGTIYKIYLAYSGIEEILLKHGYTIDQVDPTNHAFIMLEQPPPHLCADRMDYNLQGAYFQHFLTKQEVLQLYKDIYFREGKWVAERVDLLRKLADFSLFMTQDCWGSPINLLTSRWFANALLRGLEIGVFSWKEFYSGIDSDVWLKLHQSKDPQIGNWLRMIHAPKSYFQVVGYDQAALFLKFRSRGIDPWVVHQQRLVTLSMIDEEFAQELQRVKAIAERGWPIQWINP